MVIISPQAPLWAREFARNITTELNRSGPLRLAQFSTDNLPDAAEYEAHMVWNTTIDRVCVSDGTNWLRQDTGASV